jgi:hypothetical protein
MKRDKNRIARLRIRPVDEAQAVVAAPLSPASRQ